jgi:hypothetical protein
MTYDKTRKMTDTWTLRDHRDYAWEYFKVHAQQRMSLFNFFVIFSSLATTCLVATFQEKAQAHLVGIGLGVLLLAISFVFWKLDERVRFLVKHAERALKWIETKYHADGPDEKPHVLQLFTCEEALTADELAVTYAKCFRWTFFAFGLVGLVGAILSALYLSLDLPNSVSR